MANTATLIAIATERPLRRSGTVSKRLGLSLFCLFICFLPEEFGLLRQ
jgi:hypothetical protein